MGVTISYRGLLNHMHDMVKVSIYTETFKCKPFPREILAFWLVTVSTEYKGGLVSMATVDMKQSIA